eukprot:Gb_02950 [translate_table: standard]
MVRFIAMWKLACFSVFARKNKVKSEDPVSVDHIESCQISSTACSVLDYSKEAASESICIDVVVPSDLPTWSTSVKDSKTVEEMGNIISEKNCSTGFVGDQGKHWQSKPMIDSGKTQCNANGSDCDFSFQRQTGKMENEAPVEVAYEGGDEDEILSSREVSDHESERTTENKVNSKIMTDVKAGTSGTLALFGNSSDVTFEFNYSGDKDQPNEEMLNGHLSDPGLYKMGELRSGSTSPVFQRSCSGSKLETRQLSNQQTGGRSPDNHSGGLPPSNSQSFEDLQLLAGGQRGIQCSQSSPLSELTFRSADKIMLKRGSSSKVLPSRRRKSWWKMFLWSHRNLHKFTSEQTVLLHQSEVVAEVVNKKEGYSSDTLDVCRTMHQTKEGQNLGKLRSLEKDCMHAVIKEHDGLKTAHGSRHTDWKHPSRVTGDWPCNQWVAFSTEHSNMRRVEEWVSSIDTGTFSLENGDSSQENAIVLPECMAEGSSIAEISEAFENANTSGQDASLTEEMQLANNAIHSLNAFSTVAHISGIGLSVIPALALFTSLRTINLSGNFIVRITPGSLPRSLHTLNLSRNKITTTEGLRELTRLRVLDLSYNRISRIGHGLANCTLIKELYLAGNKISDVEGLHRLLKLTVLDLSFNKITTSKALGQLAANYSSLLALNLLGNPVHTNVGDEQLRRSISSLLPHLAYLNKQPIKTVSAREAVVDSVARAALGNSGRHSRNKQSRRGSHTSSTHRTGASVRRGSRSTEGASRTQVRQSKHTRDKGKGIQEQLPSRRASVPLSSADQKLNNSVLNALPTQSMHCSQRERHNAKGDFAELMHGANENVTHLWDSKSVPLGSLHFIHS